AQKARAPHPRQGGASDAAAMPALRRHETAPSRLPDVRILQRRTASDRRGLMIRIALDAMGSDNAPQVEVEGVAQALKELPAEFQIQLVGRKADIEAALGRVPPPGWIAPASKSSTRRKSWAWATSRWRRSGASRARRSRSGSDCSNRASRTHSSRRGTPGRCWRGPPCCRAWLLASSERRLGRCFHARDQRLSGQTQG